MSPWVAELSNTINANWVWISISQKWQSHVRQAGKFCWWNIMMVAQENLKFISDMYWSMTVAWKDCIHNIWLMNLRSLHLPWMLTPIPPGPTQSNNPYNRLKKIWTGNWLLISFITISLNVESKLQVCLPGTNIWNRCATHLWRKNLLSCTEENVFSPIPFLKKWQFCNHNFEKPFLGLARKVTGYSHFGISCLLLLHGCREPSSGHRAQEWLRGYLEKCSLGWELWQEYVVHASIRSIVGNCGNVGGALFYFIM